MSGVVEFDPALFREMYPRFAGLPDAALRGHFETAALLVGNTPASRVPYDPPGRSDRKTVLYLLVCHLAALETRGDMVGAVTGAAQGSVNATLSVVQRAKPAWWDQTQCGATAWELLKPYRTGGLYVPGC